MVACDNLSITQLPAIHLFITCPRQWCKTVVPTTLPETYSKSLKNAGKGRRSFPFGFRPSGAFFSFREGIWYCDSMYPIPKELKGKSSIHMRHPHHHLLTPSVIHAGIGWYRCHTWLQFLASRQVQWAAAISLQVRSIGWWWKFNKKKTSPSSSFLEIHEMGPHH